MVCLICENRARLTRSRSSLRSLRPGLVCFICVNCAWLARSQEHCLICETAPGSLAREARFARSDNAFKRKKSKFEANKIFKRNQGKTKLRWKLSKKNTFSIILTTSLLAYLRFLVCFVCLFWFALLDWLARLARLNTRNSTKRRLTASFGWVSDVQLTLVWLELGLLDLLDLLVGRLVLLCLPACLAYLILGLLVGWAWVDYAWLSRCGAFFTRSNPAAQVTGTDRIWSGLAFISEAARLGLGFFAR